VSTNQNPVKKTFFCGYRYIPILELTQQYLRHVNFEIKKQARETCLQEQLFPIEAGENIRL
jgi:hypothetical protein